MSIVRIKGPDNEIYVLNSVDPETLGAGVDQASVSPNTIRVPTRAWVYAYDPSTAEVAIRAGFTGVQTSGKGFLNSLPQAQYNATAPTLADGNFASLQLDTSGNLKTTSGASENHLGSVSVHHTVATATFTRPGNTTGYVSGDILANDVLAANVVPMQLAVARVNSGLVQITRVALAKSSTSIVNARFRVHFYKDAPTPSNGDNGLILTNESNYIGYVDIIMDRVFVNSAKGFGVPDGVSSYLSTASSGTKNIYALIETRASYTPTSSEIFTLTVEVAQD